MRFASFTPLPVHWPHSRCTITRGIQIIEKPIFNENNWPFWNLRRTEQDRVLGRTHWLCIESECEHHKRTEVSRVADSPMRVRKQLRQAESPHRAESWGRPDRSGRIITMASSSGAGTGRRGG
jgi:hypothetical protein